MIAKFFLFVRNLVGLPVLLLVKIRFLLAYSIILNDQLQIAFHLITLECRTKAIDCRTTAGSGLSMKTRLKLSIIIVTDHPRLL